MTDNALKACRDAFEAWADGDKTCLTDECWQAWCAASLVNARATADNAWMLLRDALIGMVRETTCLSVQEDDGSHRCYISAQALYDARQALIGVGVPASDYRHPSVPLPAPPTEKEG